MRPEIQPSKGKRGSQRARGGIRARGGGTGGNARSSRGFDIQGGLPSVDRHLQAVCKCLLVLADELCQGLCTMFPISQML